jgi:mitogen-activated protein kinase organizer 1
MTLSEAKDSISSITVLGPEILAGSVDGRLRTYDIRQGKIATDVIACMYALTTFHDILLIRY